MDALQKVPAATTGARASQEERSDRAGAPNGHIMVVDDQPANLKLLEDLLTQQGHTVRSFPRGRLALDSAVRSLPDLILLDINMPEMDGVEVCKRLKADKKLLSARVLCLSPHTQAANKMNVFPPGGVNYTT